MLDQPPRRVGISELIGDAGVDKSGVLEIGRIMPDQIIYIGVHELCRQNVTRWGKMTVEIEMISELVVIHRAVLIKIYDVAIGKIRSEGI